MAGRKSWSWIGWIAGIILLAVVLALLFIYSGVFNVSAAYPDPRPVAWALDTTMTRSVQHHARGIKTPDLNSPSMIKTGSEIYRTNCVFCHGAPGVEIGTIGKAFNPQPPELVEAVKDWKPNELFWLTKNGVRMTAMPAWQTLFSDNDIWSLVSFMEKLPTMKPEAYKAMGGKPAK